MKKEQAFRQDNLKSYLIGLVVFIITLALGIFIFFFCVQETIEKRAEASVMDVLSQQKAHFHSVLDVQTEIWEAETEDVSAAKTTMTKNTTPTIVPAAPIASKTLGRETNIRLGPEDQYHPAEDAIFYS